MPFKFGPSMALYSLTWITTEWRRWLADRHVTWWSLVGGRIPYLTENRYMSTSLRWKITFTTVHYIKVSPFRSTPVYSGLQSQKAVPDTPFWLLHGSIKARNSYFLFLFCYCCSHVKMNEIIWQWSQKEYVKLIVLNSTGSDAAVCYQQIIPFI